MNELTGSRNDDFAEVHGAHVECDIGGRSRAGNNGDGFRGRLVSDAPNRQRAGADWYAADGVLAIRTCQCAEAAAGDQHRDVGQTSSD